MATRTFTFDTDSDYPPVSDLVVNVGASFTCTYTVTTPSGSAYDFTGFTTSSAQMAKHVGCLLYTSPSPRDAHESRMPSSA